MPSIPRSKLPGNIYAVPVTLSVLVDARGITEEDRIEDAKLEARKAFDAKLRVEVGAPKVMT